MVRKIIFSLIFFLIATLLVSCSNSTVNSQIDSDLELRIDILYGHTLQMQQLSSDEQLVAIGLDVSKLDPTMSGSSEQKVEELEASYGIISEGSYEERIEVLEDKMVEMMDEWVKLQ